MITVAIANQKGGVGKSATTVCLAGCLVDRGYRVLVVDLEPQCTATEWLGLLSPSNRGDDLEDPFGPALMRAILDGEEPPVYRAPCGCDLVPGGNELHAFDIDAARIKRGEREYLLSQALEKLRPEWDVVLIDTPPSLGLLTVNALTAADYLLLPVKLESASRTPLVRLIAAAEEVHQEFNERLDVIGVVGAFYDTRRQHSRAIFGWLKEQFAEADRELQPEHGSLVFPKPLRNCTHVSESVNAQLPVTAYLREEKIRSSIANEDFNALADAFVLRAGLEGVEQEENDQKEVVNG